MLLKKQNKKIIMASLDEDEVRGKHKRLADKTVAVVSGTMRSVRIDRTEAAAA
jgi:hypothetical protein